jgi:hypothetical protein
VIIINTVDKNPAVAAIKHIRPAIIKFLGLFFFKKYLNKTAPPAC